MFCWLYKFQIETKTEDVRDGEKDGEPMDTSAR